MQVLHKFLQYNTKTIEFWLESLILPQQTRLFPGNLRKSAWHMVETGSGKARHQAEAAPCTWRVAGGTHATET